MGTVIKFVRRSTPRGRSQDTNERASKAAKRSRGKRRTKLTSQRALFALLFQELRQSEPQLPVGREVLDAMGKIFRSVRDGKCMWAPILWAGIFWSIEWAAFDDPSASRCGFCLLSFAGELGNAIGS